jgi:hypothetical protein
MFLIFLLIPANFQSFNFLNKNTSLLDGPCFLTNTKLESGVEQLYAFSWLIN